MISCFGNANGSIEVSAEGGTALIPMHWTLLYLALITSLQTFQVPPILFLLWMQLGVKVHLLQLL